MAAAATHKIDATFVLGKQDTTLVGAREAVSLLFYNGRKCACAMWSSVCALRIPSSPQSMPSRIKQYRSTPALYSLADSPSSIEVGERFPLLGPCPEWLSGLGFKFYAHTEGARVGRRISPSEMTRSVAMHWLAAALSANAAGVTAGERAVALALASSPRLSAMCIYAQENLSRV